MVVALVVAFVGGVFGVVCIIVLVTVSACS